MKKRILSIVLLFVMCFSFVSIPKKVSAEAILSEEYAQSFLRFLSNNAGYTPEDKDIFFALLTGKPLEGRNKDNVKLSFIEFVYNSIDEDMYNNRLNKLKDHLIENEVPETLMEAASEIVASSVKDELVEQFTGVSDLGDVWDGMFAILYSIAAVINIRGNGYAHYFKSLIGLDQNDPYYDIWADEVIVDAWMIDRDMADSWLAYMYELECEVLETAEEKIPTTYTITFDSNCGDVNGFSKTYNADEKVETVEIERPEYIFCGWYHDPDCTNKVQRYTKCDQTWYAKWEPRYCYVTYDSNCAYVDDVVYRHDRLIEDENIIAPNMQRDGYILDGWYWDAAGTQRVQFPVTIDRDLTIYAKWEPEFTWTVTDGKITITGLKYIHVSNSVVIPKQIDGCDVVAIGDNAFKGIKEITNVTIPDSITSIGDSAFNGCDKLTSVIIPNSVTSIGDSAFYGCKNLASVTISNGVTSIGSNAFSECTRLTNIMIPNSVTNIGINAFASDSITSINVGSNNQAYASIDGVLYNKSLTEVIAFPKGKSGEYSIPNGITRIADATFYSCDKLTSVIIPNSVTSIGDSAFNGCNKLTSVIIPNSVTSIGDSAFANCGFANITIPNSVTSIGDSAFYLCVSLENVIIPNSVTSIGDGAFYYCFSLKDVTIPASVTSIGDSAFRDCGSLTNVTIPASVTSIGDSAFRDCGSLTNVTIPSSVTSIGDFAFYNCNSLISITLPDGVRSLGNSTFCYCEELRSVTIPDSVTSIGEFAFSRCYSLKNITIPSNITSIGESAFSVTYLKNVYYSGAPEEWNNIQIASDNTYLTSATRYYAPSLYNTDGNLRITAFPGGYNVILASFDSDDRLYEIKTLEYNFQDAESTIFTIENLDAVVNVPDGGYIKAMLWDSIGSMIPMCGSEVVTTNEL